MEERQFHLLLEINKKYKITIITTSANQNLKELKQSKHIEVLVDINNMASVIATKSLVITASGGTLFEVLALKKKFINIFISSVSIVILPKILHHTHLYLSWKS